MVDNHGRFVWGYLVGGWEKKLQHDVHASGVASAQDVDRRHAGNGLRCNGQTER